MPHPQIRIQSRNGNTTVSLDGQEVKMLQAITVEGSVSDRIPTVTLKIKAVELIMEGDVKVDAEPV